MKIIVRIAAISAIAAFGAAAAVGQDYNLRPNFATLSLDEGFTPDPRAVRVSSGGNINASRLGGACVGFISQRPDVRLVYRTSGNSPLIIKAMSGSDTTLVVNAPNGRWYCDDDSGGDNNPLVRFNRPRSGNYEIWVGTYGNTQLRNARVLVTEIDN